MVFEADLIDWALVRVMIGEEVSTHAVGNRFRDVNREGGYVLTNPVRDIDRANRRLTTQNSVYELAHPIDDYPSDLLSHWIMLIVMRAKRAPDRIEFLKADGSSGRSMNHAEVVATVGAPGICDRVEAVMASNGRTRRRPKAGPSF